MTQSCRLAVGSGLAFVLATAALPLSEGHARPAQQSAIADPLRADGVAAEMPSASPTLIPPTRRAAPQAATDVYWDISHGAFTAGSYTYKPSDYYTGFVSSVAAEGWVISEGTADLATSPFGDSGVLVINIASFHASAVTEAEVDAIETWVIAGGGLLVMCDNPGVSWHGNLSLLLTRFSLSCAVSNSSTTYLPTGDHETNASVTSLTSSGGGVINGGEGATITLNDGTSTTAAVKAYGSGRVALIGDVNIWDNVRYTSNSNVQWGLNIFAWLSAGHVDRDSDGDGFDIPEDCDDTDAGINPGATEFCDGVDQDCDEAVDEGTLSTFHEDADDDGFGQGDSTTQACSQPEGYAVAEGDCDDDDSSAFPGATEVCDGDDEDCDGSVDEGTLTTFYEDADDDGFGQGDNTAHTCSQPEGYAEAGGDCDDDDSSAFPGATEVCDGDDEDCDEAVDEGTLSTFHEDADDDGFGQGDSTAHACSQPEGYAVAEGDCDDDDSSAFPGATEVCDGDDEDCDGSVDEGTLSTFYEDADDDGFGQGDNTAHTCSQPEGYAEAGGDCDDDDSSAFPGATEVCDGDDEDCDEAVDEGTLSTFYEDADDDGFGDAEGSTAACTRPEGYVDEGGDCDDDDNGSYPGADEICDQRDQDCDEDVDEGVETAFYPDSDDDGFGVDEGVVSACEAEQGYVDAGGDCDDDSNTIFPGADETCGDGIDQDCNGVDLSCDVIDGDGDGFAPVEGDCDDTDAGVFPGAEESCDGVDEDCDGAVDEIDGDEDGYITDSCQGDDCDDSNGAIFPGATESLNGADDDCDGAVDEGFATPSPTPGDDTPTLAVETGTPGDDTPTLAAETGTPGDDTPTLAAETGPPGNDTPTLAAETGTPADDTPTQAVETGTPGGDTPTLPGETGTPAEQSPTLGDGTPTVGDGSPVDGSATPTGSTGEDPGCGCTNTSSAPGAAWGLGLMALMGVVIRRQR